MFEVWLQMSDTNIDTENPNDLPALQRAIDLKLHYVVDHTKVGE